MPERFALASPPEHVRATSPATFLLHAADDHIVPLDSRRLLRRKIVEAGVPTVCLEYPRTGRAFDSIVPALLARAGQSALYDVERFVACSGHH